MDLNWNTITQKVISGIVIILMTIGIGQMISINGKIDDFFMRVNRNEIQINGLQDDNIEHHQQLRALEAYDYATRTWVDDYFKRK